MEGEREGRTGRGREGGKENERDRESRQRQRQTDGQTDRHARTQTHTLTDMHTDRSRHREAERVPCKHLPPTLSSVLTANAFQALKKQRRQSPSAPPGAWHEPRAGYPKLAGAFLPRSPGSEALCDRFESALC